MNYDDDDNSDNYTVPPGFALKHEPDDAHTCPHGLRAWFGNECGECEGSDDDMPDIAIVMGRPVVPNAVETMIGNKIGIDFSDPYDGSEKMTCKMCMREVWVGPQQREKMSEVAGCIVMCPEHAVQSMHEVGGSMENVVSLGHEHERGN